MKVDTWLEAARADAQRRGLGELAPLLSALAKATTVLRSAEWQQRATDSDEAPTRPAEPR